MTLAHHAEMLDALLNDVNWKTMVNLGVLFNHLCCHVTNLAQANYISKSYTKAVEERENAQIEFEKLDSTTSEEQRHLWTTQEAQAHANRLTDVTAMDIYSSKLEAGAPFLRVTRHMFLFIHTAAPPRAQLELKRMEEEQNSGGNVGMTAWIVAGIEIQQQQLRIQDEMARHANPTTVQNIKVAKMKEKVIKCFEDLMNTAEYLFPDVDFTKLVYKPGPWCRGNSDTDPIVTRPVPLPSQVDVNSMPGAFVDAQDTEIILRMGEANDALQGIRTEIGYKSYIYRAQIRPYKGKNQRTRGWDNIKRSDHELKFQQKVYTNALASMKALGAKANILAQYKDITKEDLQVVTAVSEPNARGQSKETMAWFWSLDVAGDSDESEHLEECESAVSKQPEFSPNLYSVPY